VASDSLRGFQGAVIFQKIRDASRPKKKIPFSNTIKLIIVFKAGMSNGSGSA